MKKNKEGKYYWDSWEDYIKDRAELRLNANNWLAQKQEERKKNKRRLI